MGHPWYCKDSILEAPIRSASGGRVESSGGSVSLGTYLFEPQVFVTDCLDHLEVSTFLYDHSSQALWKGRSLPFILILTQCLVLVLWE
jgi:hypothetical protein